MHHTTLRELLAQPPCNTTSARPDATVTAPADTGQFAVQGRLPCSRSCTTASSTCALVEQVLDRPSLYAPEALTPFVLTVGPLGNRWPQDRTLRERVIDALHTALAVPERTTADYA